MKLVKRIALAASAACLWLGPFAAADQVSLKVTQIMDNSGFEKPISSASSLIPADWTTEGGIIWNTRGECTGGYQPKWSAKSPDGQTTIEMLPTFGWRTNNIGMRVPADCIRQPIASANEFVEFLVAQLEYGKVLEVENDAAAQQMLAPFASEFQGDPYSRTWADYTSALVSYEYEGTKMRAIAIVMTMHSYMKSGHSYGFGQVMETTNGGAFSITVFAAPEDEFENSLQVFQTFAVNYRPNPEWQQRIAKHNRRIGDIALKGARDRAKTTAKTYSDISSDSMSSWRKRQASEDRMSREMSEATFGTETYDADTSTGQVELPYGYDDVWQMPDDTFVLSNDPFFEPADGKRLTVTE